MKHFTKKRATVIILILAIAFSIGCSKTVQIITYLEKGDYLSAMEEYAKLSDEASKNVAEAQIEEKCAKTINEYNQGSASLEEADALLQTIEKTKILSDQEIQDAKIRLNELKGSKEAFQIAEDYYAKENYIAAIDFYGNVIREDTCFEDAQNKLEKAREKYIEKVKEAAAQAAAEDDYQTAISALTVCSNNLGGVSELEMLIKKYQTDSDNLEIARILNQVEEYRNQDKYTQALVLLHETDVQYANREEIKAAILHYEKEYSSQIINKAEQLYSENKYDEAIAALHAACSYVSDQTELDNEENKLFIQYSEVVKTKTVAEIAEYVTDNQYADAIKSIDRALEQIGQDQELLNLKIMYVDIYVAQIVSMAADTYIEYDLDSIIMAEEYIVKALDVLPDNEILQKELDHYKACEPIRLLDLPASRNLHYDVSLSAFVYKAGKKDAAGNLYTDAIAPSAWYENSHPYGWSRTYSYAHYSWMLDYQYSRITGVIFFDEDYKSADIDVELKITPSTGHSQSVSISNKSEAQYFSIDLSGAQEFEISIEQSEIHGTYAYLADVYIWK